MPDRYCLRCGRPFAGDDADLCPSCVVADASLGSDRAAPAAQVPAAHVPAATRAFLTDETVPAEWRAGDVLLDRYEVRGLLGEGGMARVYRVWHRDWNRELAVKAPRPEVLAQTGTKAFADEAGTWVELGLHPHIVSCFYVRTLGCIPRVFAELIDGGSLKDWIADRRLYAGPREDVTARLLDVAIQFAWALGYAHEQGLVHQDVKPANVLLSTAGVAKVTDFGLAGSRVVSLPAAEGSTVVHGVGGTPAYYSPEQADAVAVPAARIADRERGWLTRRTDIWSWAASVLEMYAGERTWEWGQAVPDALDRYAAGDPPQGIPPMPPSLAALLRECLQVDPARRPHDFPAIAEQVAAVYRQVSGDAYPRQQAAAAELRADSLNNKALSLLDLGRREEAEKAWEQALADDPHHPEATFNLGLIRWRRGETDDVDVLRQLTDVAASRPGDWLPPYLLGQVHLERDDCESAAAVLGAASDRGPLRSEITDATAVARQRLPHSGRLMAAVDELAVNAVVSAPDGRLAMVASGQHELRIWDSGTGATVRDLPGHRDMVWSVSVSADGRRVASGSWDHTARVWDVTSGECLRVVDAGAEVDAVGLLPDAGQVVSGAWDGGLRVWDVSAGRQVRSLEGHRDRVTSLCVSADGGQVLSGSVDGTARLWSLEDGRCLRVLEGHGAPVLSVTLSGNGRTAASSSSVTMSEDGRRVLAGSRETVVIVWDVASGAIRRALPHDVTVPSVALSSDGSHLVAACGDGWKLWEVATGRCLRTYQHGSTVRSIAPTPDGRSVLAGGSQLQLWRVGDPGTVVAPLRLSGGMSAEVARANEERFRGLLAQAERLRGAGAFGEAGRMVRMARATAGFERKPEALAAWSALYPHLAPRGLSAAWCVRVLAGNASQEQVQSVSDVAKRATDEAVWSVFLRGDGRLVLAGTGDGCVHLWDPDSGQQLGETKALRWGPVTSVCADERHMLAGGADSTVRVYDVATGQVGHTLDGHEGWVSTVVLGADGRHALSGGHDATVRLWDLSSGACLRVLRGHGSPVESVALSTDGQLALSGSDDRTLRLWDVASGECLRVFDGHAHEVWAVALSPDGRVALSGSRDNTLRVWDVASGACQRTLVGHQGLVRSVRISGNGRFALSGSCDGTARLWDLRTGDCLTTLASQRGEVRSVCLGANDARAVTGSEDGTIAVWFFDWDLAEALDEPRTE